MPNDTTDPRPLNAIERELQTHLAMLGEKSGNAAEYRHMRMGAIGFSAYLQAKGYALVREEAPADQLRVQLLHPDAKPPRRSKPDDAGYDLAALADELHPKGKHLVYPGGRKAIRTGIAVAIPPGYYGRVAPRSGLAVNNGVAILGGVIDSGFRGELMVIVKNTDTDHPFIVTPGDRIAQLIIEKIATPEVKIVAQLDQTERGDAGLGSTGMGTDAIPMRRVHMNDGTGSFLVPDTGATPAPEDEELTGPPPAVDEQRTIRTESMMRAVGLDDLLGLKEARAYLRSRLVQTNGHGSRARLLAEIELLNDAIVALGGERG